MNSSLSKRRAAFRIIGSCRHYGTLVAVFVCLSAAQAQMNNWTNSVSDRWESSANWSLGIPPDASQSIVVTNNGYKSIGIFPTTPINYPAAMAVHDLTLSGIPGSFNTLLMNYSGTEVPLRVSKQCEIGENARILNLYSGLTLGALFVKVGQFQQVGGTLTVTGPTVVANGALMLTNAEAVLGDLSIGGESGYHWPPPSYLYDPGTIIVSGGSLMCGKLKIGDSHSLGRLIDGSLSAKELMVTQGSEFDQLGVQAQCEIQDTVTNLGVINISGGRFSASHFIMAGSLTARNASLQFGTLALTGDSEIDFASNSTIIKFDGTSQTSWNPKATLRISHWSGLLDGGGSSGIWFGNNGSGLNSNQLGQIEFLCPDGLLAGLYRARVLESGELVPTGRISVFGWSSAGPHFTDTSAPAGLTNVVGIAVRWNTSIALMRDGTVVEWLFYDFYDPNSALITNVVAGLSNIVAIDGQDIGAMALREDGTAFGWGYAFLHEITNAIAICAGAMCAVRADGTPVFQLHGDYPTNWTDLVQIAGSHGHILGLRSDGKLMGWGSVQFGNVPMEIPAGLSNVVSVACGGDESIALRNDGAVVAWGQYPTPPLSNVVAVAATAYYSVALHSDGTVTTWGDGPIDLGLSNVVAIAGGEGLSLALLDPVPVQPFSLHAPRTQVSGSVHFDFEGHRGHRYLIECSTNLLDWSFFRLVDGMNRPVEISDFPPVDSTQRYYRARHIQ